MSGLLQVPANLPQIAREILEVIPETDWHPQAIDLLSTNTNETWVIACSGGADSLMALLLVHASFLGKQNKLVVAHFNHNLRGEESMDDALFVKEVARVLNIEVVIGLAQKIDKIVTVEDSEIIHAMFLLMERSRAVVEPAGAVALAYILKHNPEPGKNVVPILCGGNIDMYLLGQIVSKGLSGMGRMLKISVLLKDKPGALKELVDEISSINVNIVEVIHDRLSSEVNAGSAEVTISLETEDQKQSNELINHLRDKNIEFQVIS